MDVRGELIDPVIWSIAGESLTRTNISDSDTLSHVQDDGSAWDSGSRELSTLYWRV